MQTTEPVPFANMPHAEEETYSFPLSAQQRGLWFIQYFDPWSAAYNTPFVLRLRGSLDIAALRQALTEIIRRHEILRTTFMVAHDGPRQIVRQPKPVVLPLVDLGGLSPALQDEVALQLRREDVERPVDLERGPVMRITLLRCGEQDHELRIVMHHIATDGWSKGVLLNELTLLYGAYCRGRSSSLPDLPVQYADYALWQRELLLGEAFAAHLDYWRQKLAHLTPLQMPRDASVPSHKWRPGETLPITFPMELHRQLRALARRCGVTIFVVLLAAFKLLLRRYAGQTDVAVGTIVANRHPRETENLIGCFVNTLVLRSDLRGPLTFTELVRRIESTVLEAYEHQDVPFDKIVEEVNPESRSDGMPLVQALFLLQNTTPAEHRMGGLELEQIAAEYSYAFEDLCISMQEEQDALTGIFTYSTETFARPAMERFVKTFEHILKSVCAAPGEDIESVPLLTGTERQQVLYHWNHTEAAELEDKSLPELFERQADKTPHAPAVCSEQHPLSYAELDRRANQLAHYLRARGCAPETIVGVLVERSPEMVIAFLGVLKAGAAYLPLDPACPPKRLEFMLREGRVQLLLTQQSLARHVAGVTAVCLDDHWPEIAGHRESRPRNIAAPENTAYVIYTSGSTGQPKGVVIQNRSLVSYVQTAVRAFQLSSADRVLQFASIAFDTSVEEIYPCLLTGGTLVLHRDGVLGGSDFLKQCAQREITVLDLPTAYWHVLLDDTSSADWKLAQGLRLVVIGGEQASSVHMEKWRKLVGRRIRLLNTYGPTEGTVVSTLYEIPERIEFNSGMVIGCHISGVQTFILDDHMEPVPVGVPGELYIGGIGLAREYLHRPDLTAERFIPHPHAVRPGERLYRTGDLGRYRATGDIEFLGRRDEQLKIRGFRIELREIEARLMQFPGITEAVTVTLPDSIASSLAAYYTCSDTAGEKAPDAEQLRNHLAAALPEYMVPSFYVKLQSLPLTSSGKVDRKALASMDGNKSAAGFALPDLRNRLSAATLYLAPRTSTEEILAGIWSQLLRVERVGVNDNFFKLGGHSLLAVILGSRVRESFGIALPLSAFFRQPTITALAAYLDSPDLSREGPLVILRSGSEGQPLFLVHAVGGGLFAYRELLLALPGNRPLYGIQRPGFESGPVEQLEIEQLAAIYLRSLQRRQDHGPYALAGWSFGGVVAFEMARQLEAMGERVNFLGLIDTPPPPGQVVDGAGFSRPEVEAAVDREMRASGLSPGSPVSERLRMVLHAHAWAMHRYSPQSGMEAQSVVLFRALQATNNDGDAAAWQALSHNPVEQQGIAGDHYSILAPPQVTHLAQALSRALAEVENLHFRGQ